MIPGRKSLHYILRPIERSCSIAAIYMPRIHLKSPRSPDQLRVHVHNEVIRIEHRGIRCVMGLDPGG